MKKVFLWFSVFVILLFLGGIFYFGLKTGPALVQLPREEENLPHEDKTPPKEETLVKEDLPKVPQKILYLVPFTSQAPLAEWAKPVFQNACEEASVLMAVLWKEGKSSPTKDEARSAILKISQWEEKKIGHSIDTNAADTEKLLLKEYSKVEGSALKYDFSLEDLKAALERGVIIVPTNGQKLGNPNFTQPGPLTHMLVIIGYDPETKKFTTNDPGTRFGAGYKYDETVLYDAIRDYPTGKHLPIKSLRKAMIIVPKP